MKGCLTALGIVAGLVLVGIVSCSIAYPTIHVRYRLTVEVNVGDQIKTGSGVIGVDYPIYPDSFVSLDGPGNHSDITGYAITVDLGEKGLLLLTLAGAERTPDQRRARTRCPMDDEIGCLPIAAYGIPNPNVGGYFSRKKAALDELFRHSGPRDVPFADLPRLVWFPDFNDPKSWFVSVSPYDLERKLGPGVKLSRVTLELTDSAVTPMPKIWPEWLKAIRSATGILWWHEPG
jgi:hypothetical protein